MWKNKLNRFYTSLKALVRMTLFIVKTEIADCKFPPPILVVTLIHTK